MDVYCCFSFITQQKCQVSSHVWIWKVFLLATVGCIVHRGGCWHGFVLWAAADWRDRLPFEAQEVQWVRQAVISQRDSLDFLCVCTFPNLLLSLCGKLTHFFLCLCPFLPHCFTASERHRFPVRTTPSIIFLCSESRSHRLHWPCRRHTHNQSSTPCRTPPCLDLWAPSPPRRPGLEVQGLCGAPEVPNLSPGRRQSWCGRREAEATLSWGSGQAGRSAPAPDWKREEAAGRGRGGAAAADQTGGSRAELREPHAPGVAGGRTVPRRSEEQGRQWR